MNMMLNVDIRSETDILWLLCKTLQHLSGGSMGLPHWYMAFLTVKNTASH